MTIVFVNKIKTAQKVTESKLTNLVWSFECCMCDL